MRDADQNIDKLVRAELRSCLAFAEDRECMSIAAMGVAKNIRERLAQQ